MSQPPLGLVVDTTLSGIAMGLVNVETGLVLTKHIDANPRAGAANLASYLNIMSPKFGSKLQCCMVSNGPGSFTGIKVGLAFVSGLQKGWDETIFWSESSFLLLAGQLLDEGFDAILLPATQTRGALATQELGQEKVERFDLEAKAAGEFIGKRLGIFGEWRDQEVVLRDKFGFALVEKMQWDYVLETSLTVMALRMRERFVSGSKQSDKLVANYLRPSSVEEKMGGNVS